MIIDFAVCPCSARIEASRAQLSTVFHITSIWPLRNAASLAAGSSSSTNLTSVLNFFLYIEPAFGSIPLLKTMPGELPCPRVDAYDKRPVETARADRNPTNARRNPCPARGRRVRHLTC